MPAINTDFLVLPSACEAVFDRPIDRGHLIMPDRFTSTLLAALNESAEVNESDWRSIEAILRWRTDTAGSQTGESQVSENRFAATISSGMAKVRSGY